MTINALLTRINRLSTSLFNNASHNCIVVFIKHACMKVIDRLSQFTGCIIKRRGPKDKSCARDTLIKCTTKLIKHKMFRKMPFKEAEKEIRKKALKLESLSKNEDEGIPIGKYRNFIKLTHPFQKEYDSLPEDVKRELTKENSLFLSGKLDSKAKFEIMRNADSIRNVSKLNENSKSKFSILNILGLNTSRFTDKWHGVSKPVLDSLHNVFYKPGKHPSIDTTAAMLRYHMKKLGIENIILPKREFWTTRDKDILFMFEEECRNTPKDQSPRMATLMLEEHIDGILPVKNCESAYRNLDSRVLNDLVASITKIFCFIEIGDLAYRKTNIPRIDLVNISGRKIAKVEDPNYESICKFDNLPIQCFMDSDGNLSCKFVLVDIDFARSPDHTTVETLLRMFPRHVQLIIDTVQATNPELLRDYSPITAIRQDGVMSPTESLSTKEEIINNYKNSKNS